MYIPSQPPKSHLPRSFQAASSQAMFSAASWGKLAVQDSAHEDLARPRNAEKLLQISVDTHKTRVFWGGPPKKTTQRHAAFLLSLVFKYEAKIKMELENDKRKRAIWMQFRWSLCCHCALSFSKKGWSIPWCWDRTKWQFKAKDPCLVSGWTDRFEAKARQIGSFQYHFPKIPQVYE